MKPISLLKPLTTATAAILMLALAPAGFCVEWHKVDAVTFSWEAPTTDTDGAPLPAGGTFKYDIFTKDVNGSNVVMMGTVAAETATIVINAGDKKFVGAAAYWTDPDGITTGPSATAWSDVPTDCANQVTFGLHNLKAPGKPRELKR